MMNQAALPCTNPIPASKGFTLIELMIVIAIIAIIITLALPVYSNYAMRAKVSEGLSVANAAVTAVSATCIEDRAISSLTNSLAGYDFSAGSGDRDYTDDIQVTGPCTNPVITIQTKNTGQLPDPVLILTGAQTLGTGQFTWACSSINTPNFLLPKSCRS
jgi:type IV pilus assembly protein PilA